MSGPNPRPGIMDIVPYVGGESSVTGQEQEDFIKLSSNEGAFGPSPKAVAAYNKMAAELHRYPDGGALVLRQAIGDRRLRLDANEAWDPLTAIRMARRLLPFEPEFIEQPTPSHSIEALAQVKASVEVAIAADQSVFTEAEVYEICRRQAADVIVLGIHETGGLLNYRKAAAIAEAAGINLCLHGVFESGITTCASNQVIATVPNSDDGHQIMWHLLERDLVAEPDLTPVDGRLPIFDGPGLGFTLDRDAVDHAAAAHLEARK